MYIMISQQKHYRIQEDIRNLPTLSTNSSSNSASLFYELVIQRETELMEVSSDEEIMQLDTNFLATLLYVFESNIYQSIYDGLS